MDMRQVYIHANNSNFPSYTGDIYADKFQCILIAFLLKFVLLDVSVVFLPYESNIFSFSKFYWISTK